MDITRLLLHASELKITHPSGETLTLKAPLPEEFDKALALSDWTPVAAMTTGV
jgi:hypothetical protein